MLPPNSESPLPAKTIRLLVIVNVFHPDRGGGAAVFSDLSFALARRGFDVTVRCAYPYYPEWTDKSGQNGWGIRRYDEQGVHVERYGLFIPRNPNALGQRLLYEASFFFSLLRSLPRGRGFDVVMVYCPLVGSVAFAALNRWVYRSPLWLNVQDLSADAAAASGISRLGTVNRILARVQNTLFNRAGVWSSIAPAMIDRLREIRRRDQPVLFLPNWLNASLAREIEALPNKIGRPADRPVRLLYAGNIGTKQNLIEFCRTLHASSAAFRFRIQGDGGEADRIRSWVASAGDDRFSTGPFLEEPAFARALHDTDYFVITERTGSGGSFIPSKMIPGMASGTPILAVCDADSPLGLEMQVAHPGPWFPWTKLDRVPALFDDAGTPDAEFTAWQEHAVRRAALYHRDGVIDRFARNLVALAEGKPPADPFE